MACVDPVETAADKLSAFAWRALTRDRTAILISHRFSTVRMADMIVVLDGAHVAEVGSHEELMANRGPYAELYSIQAEAYR